MGLEKKMGKVFLKILKPVILPITNTLKPITKTFFHIKEIIKCIIKLTVNMPKCFIFYFLDIIKYTFLYLPILILMGILGLAKEWIPIQETLDKYLGWPNSTQNSCYRCKNKKENKNSFFEDINRMMKKNDGKGDSSFTFFSFLIVFLFVGAFGYNFWFKFLKKQN